MSQTFQARLQAVDRTVLTPLVREALASPGAEVLDWEQRPLGGSAAHVAEGILGRLHFVGQAQVQDKVVPWSLVLKAFASPAGYANEEQAAWTYWQREVLTYQSGLLDTLGGNLVAPRCFAVVAYSDEESWVWMEYIAEESKSWPLERYQLAARHLGQFNGTSLLKPRLPEYPWLNMGNLRQRLTMLEPGLNELARWAQHPRSWLTPESTERTLRLYAERTRLLDLLDRLPRCLCHHDAFRRNLLARRTPAGAEQTVAIDWSAIGPGAIGEEIATLVAFSLIFLEVPAVDASRLDALVFAGYMTGLNDVGWKGEEAVVRLNYTTATALLLALCSTGYLLPYVEEDEVWVKWEQFFARPLGDLQAQWRESHQLGLVLADEALSLLNQLGL